MPRHHPIESKTSPRRIAAIYKQARALEMRKEGKPYTEIAKALGYADDSGAYYAIMSALRRIPEPGALDYRRLNSERLAELLAMAWKAARAGDLRAVAVSLAVIAELSKLTGAYPAQQVDMSVLRIEASRMAEEAGLDAGELMAEAQRIAHAPLRIAGPDSRPGPKPKAKPKATQELLTLLNLK